MSEKKEHSQLSLFEETEVISKINSSTNLIEDLRVSPFIPKMRIIKNSEFYKTFIARGQKFNVDTPYGTLEVRNRILTQSHKDILTSIMCIGVENKSKKIENNRVVINFTMYELCQKLNLKLGGRTYKKLISDIIEIKDVAILRDTSSEKHIYSIIDDARVIGTENGNDLFRVVFSEVYSYRLASELSVNASKKLNRMLQITGEGAGLIKAIIDHFISHRATEQRPVRARLENVLITVNNIDSLKKSKMYIKNFKPTLEEFGVFYDEKSEILYYNGCENITFIKKLEPKK